MVDVKVQAVTAAYGADALRVFDAVADFESFPRLSDAVRSVEVVRAVTGELHSKWSVDFRSGELCWTESDIVDREQLSITFEQVHGDLEVFRGVWSVAPVEAGVVVNFEAQFDFGIASLAPLVDPLGRETLSGNVATILRGLLGETASFK